MICGYINCHRNLVLQDLSKVIRVSACRQQLLAILCVNEVVRLSLLTEIAAVADG